MPSTAADDAEVGCWDSVLLEQLSEDAFIGNLQARFQRDRIYTAIGTYLVAVNPFRPLPAVYGPEQVEAYATRNPFKLPPHIYGLTNGAYQWLLDHNDDQCIVLAGESNAGKTETARLVVHFLSQVADVRRAALVPPPSASSPSSSTAPSTANVAAQFGRRSTITTATRHAQTNPQHSQLHQHQQHQPHPLSRPRSVGSVPASSAAAPSQAATSTPSRRSAGGLLKKQRSMEIDRVRIRCTHEKSVEFDFSHHRSSEALHVTASHRRPATSASASASRHCAKHHCHHDAVSPTAGTSPSALRTPSPHSVTPTAQQSLHHNHHSGGGGGAASGRHHCPCHSLALPHLDQHHHHQPHCAAGHRADSASRQSASHQCSCPGSPKEVMRSAERARQRLTSSSSLLGSPATATAAMPTTSPVTKKILKNSISRSASVRDARSSASSSLSAATTTTGAVGGNAHPDAAEVARMRERIAQAEVFLEAIGNATTARNFNASRYGKFFDIEIDFKGDPIAGHITHYMLEKTRITTAQPGERNFHIFYQLLSGAEIQFLKLLKLQRNVDKYHLLRHGSATEEDRSNFAYTKRSLELLGFGPDEVYAVFKVLAAVLKLGNLCFVPSTHIDGTEGCAVTNDYELDEVAQLLHIDARVLLNCLTRNTAMEQLQHQHHHHGSSTTTEPPATAAVIADRTRSLLCRHLYGRLFAWLVGRINQALRPPRAAQRQRGRQLGVLDLCGFEQVAGSSFEQLCINYADERLHQHYVRSVIGVQTELYAREGLELARIACFDNSGICELLDRPHFGLLTLLDESHVRGGDAIALAARLRQCCAGHPSFVCNGEGGTAETATGPAAAPQECSTSSSGKPMASFQIRHFAGTVQYNTRDLVAKNCDPLPRHIGATLHHHSRLALVHQLFPEGKSSSSATSPSPQASQAVSLGATLRTQLSTLLQLIGPRKAHHVFCVTPNARRQCSAHFDLALVQHQVRYHSLLPLVRLWRTGHCHSVEHGRFVERYKLLNVGTWPHAGPDVGTVAAVARIVQGLPLPAAEFTIGIRRVLVRSPRTVYELEGFRRARLNDLACLVQTVWRGWVRRRRFVRLRHSQMVIASAWRTWRECRFGIPFAGRRHLWGLYRVAREEYKAAKYRQQIDWATTVIHRQYVQWKRRQFLRTLPLRLPANSASPLCTEWVSVPPFLAETAQLLRLLFHRWRCHRYRRLFDQTARNRMREKVTASIIFRDRKASYARSVAHPFVGDYVRLRQNVQWKKICVETNDQYVVFADIVNKIARSSGKFVPILLVISTSSMLLLDQRTLQIKYRVPAAEIYRLSLSPYLDDIAVFHVKADFDPSPNARQRLSDDDSGCLFQSEMGRKKGDFVFQTGHVIEIVTKLFLVVQNATAKPPEVHISTDFEANFGQQTVVLTFKCATPMHETHSGPEPSGNVASASSSLSGSSGAISTKCTRRGNRMEIIV